MLTSFSKALALLFAVVLFGFSASPASADSFAVGGTVSGLAPGTSVVLLDDRADTVTVTANGQFSFPTFLTTGATYEVTVGTQPSGQLCTVSHGSGRVPGFSVATVQVSCQPAYTIGGTVSGLATGTSVTLVDDHRDVLTIGANGVFTFATALPSGSPYRVHVRTEPSGETCKLSHAEGVVVTANVTNVAVSCGVGPGLTIGGNVFGLNQGDAVTLLDNGSDTLTVTANGPFFFASTLETGDRYDVTVGTQPVDETCTVHHGDGRVPLFNVNDVAIFCAPSYTLGGTVSGLPSGESFTLLDFDGNPVTISTNGPYTFPARFFNGSFYHVGVPTQPLGELCAVSNANGRFFTGNVTNVNVSCKPSANYTVGGTVSGLSSGASLVLLDNGGDALTLAGNGAFTFATPLDPGTFYDVRVATQPTGLDCSVANGRGVMSPANVTNVAVTCGTAGTHTIGGTVSGLGAGLSVTLLDNGGDATTVSANGRFIFPTPLADESTYKVTVATQPTGQNCSVTNGSGQMERFDINNVTVLCTGATTSFSIGGSVSGLNPGASVTLLDNGGDDKLTLTGNGGFTFARALAAGAAYAVTVGTQPVGENCMVSNGSGAVGSANITNVAVTCTTNTFTIGGAVAGLSSGASVTLLDNGTDSLKLTSNGNFTFAKALAAGAVYNVTVSAQPAGETCTVSNGSGTVGSGNVTNVGVTCTVATFTIGGGLSGLSSGASVTLSDNGNDPLTLTSNGSFTFAKALNSGASYAVTVSVQPAGETCSVGNGSGTVGNANVTNVAVTCSVNTFTIGGSVSGLNAGASVTLLDNGTDPLTLGGNGSFTFAKPIATGSPYNVTVSAQPAGETCSVSNASGAVGNANVTNVAVTCTVNTFTIGGAVSGLSTGASVTLSDNGNDPLTLTSNGSFTFAKAIATGAPYAVTVTVQPAGETCSVSNGSGTVGNANVTNVALTCTVNTFTIGGTVSGLSTAASVTLLDNGSDSLTLTGNGTFSFAKALATGAAYNVTIGTQPSGETCMLANNTGTVGTVNVNSVMVTCTVNTFTVAGVVTGLSTGTSVTLFDNGSDSLTLTSNGGFTFATAIAAGAPYNVTVATQPAGENCNVSNGSGTVGNANITNVVIVCSSSSGGSGGFWMPYVATPLGVGGSTGLFLIPSGNLESAPTPLFVTTTPSQILALGQQTPNNTLTTFSPALMMFAAVGGDGNTHIYGLKLNDTTTFPTPTQLGTLSLPSTQSICGFMQAQTTLTDPTTLFVVLDTVAGSCATGTHSFQVVHYADLLSSAPMTVSINTTLINPLYQDGSLVGLVLWDSVGQALDLYSDATFSAPTQLLTGVTNSLLAASAPLADGTSFGGTVNYYTMTTASGNALYRVDSSGLTLTQVHQGTTGASVWDDNNLYFPDVTSPTTTVIYQVPLSGGTPLALFSGAYNAGTSGYQLIGGNDFALAFQFYSGVGSGTPSATVYTVPTGVTSSSAAVAGGPYQGNVTAFVASGTPNNAAGNLIFVTVVNTSTTTTYSSAVLPFSSSSNPPTAPGSAYFFEGLNGVFQVNGITDTNGGEGGGTLSQINISALLAKQFTTVGGKTFVIPSGYLAGMTTIANGVNTGLLSGLPTSAGVPSVGLAADLARTFLLTISLSNTSVVP